MNPETRAVVRQSLPRNVRPPVEADAGTWTLPGGTVCCPRHIDGCPPADQPPAAEPPVLDANGDPVPGGVPAGIPSDTYRQFMAGRVPAPGCPHYTYASEVAAGLTTCERC